MKRHLKHDRYRLEDREAESLWYAVRRELKGAGAAPRGPRGLRRPAWATAALAVVALAAIGWWFGERRPQAVVAVQPRPEIARVEAPRSEAPVVALEQPAPAESQADRPAPPAPKGSVETVRQPSTAADIAARDMKSAPATESVVAVAPEPVAQSSPQAAAGRDVTGETFEKYAVDSSDPALKKRAGAVYHDAVRYANPPRTDDVSRRSAAAPSDVGRPSLRPAPGSNTGGAPLPNGESFDAMYFEHAGTNPFVATEEDALSTFALDVDNASFTLARSYLGRGELPPAAAIRVEEFVNAIDSGWPPHGRETFRIGLDGGPSRFGEGYHLLRVGIVARSVDAAQRKPANLVFVIDVSGSMDRENRLGAVKRALRVLVDELGEGDRVGVVTYGSHAEVRLPLVDASRRDEILEVIGGLRPTGSTNAAAGLKLGYELARRDFEPGHVNRLILCSDGVANAGRATDAEGILDLARGGADDGIALSTIGFGMGNYNDVLMERLADKGDGNYFYVDHPREAERVFRENLTGLLQTVARQAKVQVEFDPRRVTRWRLLGYENRDVADRDFRNDAVDAGEVGAGHQVTALYELKLAADRDRRDDDDDEGRLGVVRLRWEAPEHDTAQAGRVTEVERAIEARLFSGRDDGGSPQYRAQALAAEFAEILRGSYWAKESRLSALVPIADGLARELPRDQAVQDLARMIRAAADLRAEGRRDDDW